MRAVHKLIVLGIAPLITLTFIPRASGASAPASRTFAYVTTSVLTVNAQGVGSFRPSLNGRSLEVGKTYSITAVPGSGYLFGVWWNGDTTGTTPTLSFTMRSNLVLQATFVTNLYPGVAGSYSGMFPSYNQGLFKTPAPVRNIGSISLKVTGQGGYSGSVKLNGATYSFSGRFDAYGYATRSIPRKNGAPLVLSLNMGFAGENAVVGNIGDGQTWTNTLQASRSFYGAKSTVPMAGNNYTFVIPTTSETGAANGPTGYSYGTFKVLPTGRVSIKGNLADGTPIAQSATLSKDGYFPVCVSLKHGTELLAAWLECQTNNVEGDVLWRIPAGRYVSAACDYRAPLVSSRYVVSTNAILTSTNLEAQFTGGNLPLAFTNRIQLTASPRAVNLSANKLTLTFTKPSGLFSGSVTAPGSTRSTPFKGVVLQNLNYGAGYLLGTNAASAVLLSPELAGGPSPGIFNVKAYGAKGTNGPAHHTDDFWGIQRALWCAGTNPAGGVVYLPAGTYTICATNTSPVWGDAGMPFYFYIPSNAPVEIRGESRESTIIKALPATRSPFFFLFGTGKNAGYYGGNTNVTFRDLTFDFGEFLTNRNYYYYVTNDPPSGFRAIFTANGYLGQPQNSASRFLIENVHFKNVAAVSIGAAGGYWTVSRCLFENVANVSDSFMGVIDACLFINCGYCPTDLGLRRTDSAGYIFPGLAQTGPALINNCSFFGANAGLVQTVAGRPEPIANVGYGEVKFSNCNVAFTNYLSCYTNPPACITNCSAGAHCSLAFDHCTIYPYGNSVCFANTTLDVTYAPQPAYAFTQLLSVDNCQVLGGKHCIYADAIKTLVLKDNTFQPSWPAAAAIILNNLDKPYIVNNRFTGNSAGIQTGPARVDNAFVSGNFFVGNPVDFSDPGTNRVVANNVFNNSSFYLKNNINHYDSVLNNVFSAGSDFGLESGGNVIMNNVMTRFRAFYGVSGNTIKDNVIYDWQTWYGDESEEHATFVANNFVIGNANPATGNYTNSTPVSP